MKDSYSVTYKQRNKDLFRFNQNLLFRLIYKHSHLMYFLCLYMPHYLLNSFLLLHIFSYFYLCRFMPFHHNTGKFYSPTQMKSKYVFGKVHPITLSRIYSLFCHHTVDGLYFFAL